VQATLAAIRMEPAPGAAAGSLWGGFASAAPPLAATWAPVSAAPVVAPSSASPSFLARSVRDRSAADERGEGAGGLGWDGGDGDEGDGDECDEPAAPPSSGADAGAPRRRRRRRGRGRRGGGDAVAAAVAAAAMAADGEEEAAGALGPAEAGGDGGGWPDGGGGGVGSGGGGGVRLGVRHDACFAEAIHPEVQQALDAGSSALVDVSHEPAFQEAYMEIRRATPLLGHVDRAAQLGSTLPMSPEERSAILGDVLRRRSRLNSAKKEARRQAIRGLRSVHCPRCGQAAPISEEDARALPKRLRDAPVRLGCPSCAMSFLVAYGVGDLSDGHPRPL
jgi:hypothetical protein